MNNLSPAEVAQLCLSSIEEVRPYLNRDVVIALKTLVAEESQSNPKRALEMATVAITVASLLDDELATGWATWSKAIALLFAQRPREALPCYRQAEAILSEYEQWLPLSRLQTGLIYILTRCGELEEALVVAAQVRPLCHRLSVDGLQSLGQLETNVGSLYRQQGKFDLASQAYERAMKAYIELGRDFEVARTKLNSANLYQEMDQYRKAETLYGEARQLLQQFKPERQDLYLVDFNMGLLAEKLGQYQKALRYLERARAGFIPEANIAFADMSRAEIYNTLNLSQEALTLAHSATQFYEKADIPDDLAQALHAQAVAWQGLGNLAMAKSCLLEARQHFTVLNSRRHVILIDLALSEIALESDDIEETRQIVSRLADVIDCDLWPNLAGEVYLLQAQILLSTREDALSLTTASLQNAYSALQQAIHITKQHPQPKLMVGVYHLLGRLYSMQEKPQAAWEAQCQAIAYLENMRANLLLDEFRISLMDDQHEVYLDGLRLLQNHPLLSAVSEQKTRWMGIFYLLNMAATLPLAQSQRGDAPDSALSQQLQELRTQWHWQQAKLEEVESERTAAEHGDEAMRQKFSEMRAAVAETESKISDLGRRLGMQSDWQTPTMSQLPEEPFAHQFQGQSAQFCNQIQQQLASHEVLLHYFIVDEQLYLLLIDDSEIGYYPLGPVALVHQFQRNWQHHLQGIQLIINNSQTAIQTAKRLLTGLGQSLIGPILDQLTRHTHLYLVYPPEWREIPFAALRTQDSYLIEQFQLTHLSTPEALLRHTRSSDPENQQRTSSEPNQKPSALILGYSEAGELPHNLHEARQVEQTLARSGWQTTLLLEEDATLHNLYRATAQSQLLHLATHAFFKPENPLFSWVRLADGQLTVADIYHQTPLLNQAVVVLSACETGRGQVRGGGLLGMARALLVSGAKSLIASLWQVEDQATARLMEHFYEQIDGSHTTINSAYLCQAQRTLATTQHPFFWAGFIYIGG